MRPLPFKTQVHRRLHVVVNAPARHTAQRRKTAGVRVKQHLVPLAGVGHHPECPAGAQLEVRDLHVVVHPANEQPFFAPVKLKRLAQLETQRHIRLGCRLALLLAPSPNEIGQSAVAAPIALRLQLRQQRPRTAPGMLGSVGIGLERLHQHPLKSAELGESALPFVFGRLVARGLEPFFDRVARQPRALGDLAVGELLAQLHAPDLAYHFHGDHLLSLLLNFLAGQLNTLVNFESALLALDGQFSVGGNSKPSGCTEATVFGPFFVENAPEYKLGEDIANGAIGKPCHVAGVIRGPKGETIANAKIDVWQADDEGFYDVQKPDLQHAQARGTLYADKDGNYYFKTVVAEPYPIPTDGPVGQLLDVTRRPSMRPAHLHFMIQATGYETLITHVFRRDDKYLSADPVIGVRDSLIAEWVPQADGTTKLDFDFVLKPSMT